MSLILKTPNEISLDLAMKAKSQRLSLNLTQVGLAKRSGVTLPSLKRFERTGLISLDSLLKIALALGALEDFETVFKDKQQFSGTLDELLNAKPTRKRGTRK